jgi:hypothetical protein
MSCAWGSKHNANQLRLRPHTSTAQHSTASPPSPHAQHRRGKESKQARRSSPLSLLDLSFPSPHTFHSLPPAAAYSTGIWRSTRERRGGGGLEGWRPAPGWSPARTTGTSSSSSAATASQGYAAPLPTCLPSLPELLRFPAAALLLISVFFLLLSQPKPPNSQNGQVCQICGDGVGLTPDGERFVACNECAFPICRDCYEYERREGTQNCPQCKTRFKRLKGKSPRPAPPRCPIPPLPPCLSHAVVFLQGARASRETRKRTASTTWRTSSTGRTGTTPSTSPSPCSTRT